MTKRRRVYLQKKPPPTPQRSPPPLPPPPQSTKTLSPHLPSLRILPNYLFGPSRINHQRILLSGVTKIRRHLLNPRTLIPPWVSITALPPLPQHLFRTRKRRMITRMKENLKGWSSHLPFSSRAPVASNSPKSWR